MFLFLREVGNHVWSEQIGEAGIGLHVAGEEHVLTRVERHSVELAHKHQYWLGTAQYDPRARRRSLDSALPDGQLRERKMRDRGRGQDACYCQQTRRRRADHRAAPDGQLRDETSPVPVRQPDLQTRAPDARPPDCGRHCAGKREGHEVRERRVLRPADRPPPRHAVDRKRVR